MPHGQQFEPRQYMLDNAFEAFYYVSDDMKRVNSHLHNYYEVYMFEAGDVTYVVGEKHYDLLPGDILLLPPGEPHCPVFNNSAVTYIRLVLWISEQFIQNTRASCNCNFALAFDNISEHHMHLLRLPPQQRDGLFRYAYAMATRPDGTYTRAENNISLLSFLILLNRHYASYNRNIDRSDSFALHLVQAVDFIVNNFDRPITLQDVADHCFLSQFHLARQFKRLMGVTVHQYITMRRIYRSRQLLLGGTKPGQAALLCGFSDYSSFYRAYLSEYGISPSSRLEVTKKIEIEIADSP